MVLIKHKFLTSNILLFYKKSDAKTKLPPKLTNLQEFLEPCTIITPEGLALGGFER